MKDSTPPADTPSFEAEVKVRFDREELDSFFDGFAPLADPFELFDALLAPAEPLAA